MAKTSQPTRAPNKALYLTDYARSAWDIGALSATLPVLGRARHDGPVSVIGWSLGGIFARQLGRRHPDVIRQVITLASPIRLKDHAHSNARRAYELLEKRHTETIQLPLEAGLDPLPVPATSVYTRLDGIVAWRACLDQPSPPRRERRGLREPLRHRQPSRRTVGHCRPIDPGARHVGALPAPARWRCAYPTPIATHPVDPS
jgi:pimeloyl-ACP methyl ester carboxylesterase